MSTFPFRRWLGLAVGVLHLAPAEFWPATPHEIAAAVEMLTEIRAGTTARQARRLDEDDIAELRAMLAEAGKR